MVRARHGTDVRLRILADRPAVGPRGALPLHAREGIYRFQGLRAYKEKFHPLWKPHYLAYRGGLMLPRILADVAVLVAGGYRRIFRK